MSAGELQIRAYAPGDEHAILRTFNRVFREVCGPGFVDRTLAQWQWAYPRNPAGMRIWLAVAGDGSIACQYAGMPMLCDTPLGERLFVHCVDSMTHPDFRRGLQQKSLFVETCRPFWDEGKRIGDALFYGFPVDAAFRIGQRYLKYHEMCVIDYLIRDRALLPLPAPQEFTVARVGALPQDLASLWQRVRQDKRCLLRRDGRYLQWRYVDNPARADYELWTARRAGTLCGLLVLKPGGGLAPDAATIADWLVPESDGAAMDALLAAATRRQQEAGRQRLLAVFAPWSHEWRALLARGFVHTPSATWLQRRLIHNINEAAITPEFLATSWWYTLGDSDLA
jgi:hypothetical protein